MRGVLLQTILILHCVIHTRRTGRTVNAAVVEKTIPPNMTVANRPGAPELAPISALGSPITNAHSQRGRHLEISLEFLKSRRFERSGRACEHRRSRTQSCTPARLPTQKQSRSPLPRHTQRAPEQKGQERLWPKAPRYSGGYALEHDELPTIGLHPPRTERPCVPDFAQNGFNG